LSEISQASIVIVPVLAMPPPQLLPPPAPVRLPRMVELEIETVPEKL
jgi:hypothetical protein